MSVKTVRRLASEIMGVGESRIRISPAAPKEAKEALTRDDVRALIKKGIVSAERSFGVPRIGAKLRKEKKKGRGGIGKRRGRGYAKISRKVLWMRGVRAQRKLLKELDASGKLAAGSFRKVYLMIKGGAFKSKGTLLSHLKEWKLLKQ